MSDLQRFESPQELAESLASFICASLTRAIAEKGKAHLVVSGGNTPIPLFHRLSNVDIPWEKVFITLADERLVPTSHERSNEGMVRRELLRNLAGSARFTALQQVSREWQGQPRFDLVLLGLGSDGHTASLFPDAPELATALSMDRELTQVLTPPSQPEPRLSLTLGGLCDCTQLVLHIEGAGKLEVLQRAREPGPVEELPIRALLQQTRVPLSVYWAP